MELPQVKGILSQDVGQTMGTPMSGAADETGTGAVLQKGGLSRQDVEAGEAGGQSAVAKFLDHQNYGDTGESQHSDNSGSGQSGFSEIASKGLGLDSKLLGGASKLDGTIAKLGIPEISQVAAVGSVAFKGASELANVGATKLDGGNTGAAMEEALSGTANTAKNQAFNLIPGGGELKGAGKIAEQIV